MQKDDLLKVFGFQASMATPPVDETRVGGDTAPAARNSAVAPTDAGKAGKGGASEQPPAPAPSLSPLDAPTTKNGADAPMGGNTPAVVNAPGPAHQAATDTQANDAEAESEEKKVYFAKPKVNPVVEAIRARGRYVADLGAGNHSIACYKRAEHTDPANTKTVYIEPKVEHPAGMLLCQHDHAEDVSLLEMLKLIDVSYQAARHRSCIRLIQGEMSAVIHALETELAATGRFYQTQGTLMMVTCCAARRPPWDLLKEAQFPDCRESRLFGGGGPCVRGFDSDYRLVGKPMTYIEFLMNVPLLSGTRNGAPMLCCLINQKLRRSLICQWFNSRQHLLRRGWCAHPERRKLNTAWPMSQGCSWNVVIPLLPRRFGTCV